MRRVFVPNDAGHDMTDAKRYGELVYMTRGALRRSAVRDHAKAVRMAIATSRPDDYVVVGGLSIMTAIAAAAFAARHGHVNFLLWERGRYIRREAELLPTAA